MVTPGTGVDPIDARLSTAPQAEPGGELPIDRLRQGQPAVDKPGAAVKADHSALKVRIERQLPRHRPVVNAGFEEQGIKGSRRVRLTLTPMIEQISNSATLPAPNRPH
jgi:hypothetical protein